MKPVIIGAGLAGLTTALAMAPRPVIILSPSRLGENCASACAQGGIAAAISDDDTPELHAADTIKAGGGLCNADIVRQVTRDGADIIQTLYALGVIFDRDTHGGLQLGLEGAHGKRRIVHVADSTGHSIMQALINVVRATSSIEIIENAVAVDLLAHNGAITGVGVEYGGERSVLPTRQVVLATGGAGALWQRTTNPLGSWGRGLALAARAGATFGDMEFMQFHPTAIDIGIDPMPLASEALRGEGCTLIDETGKRFVDELQPRDVVARAIWQHSLAHKVFLDARTALGKEFATRFPGIYAVCRAASIDPSSAPIPVSPATHYHMGGVATDARGRTNVSGLWACGEVANTGLHGANRLASNSLLEAASFGRRVAEDVLASHPYTGPSAAKMNMRRAEGPTVTKHIRAIMSQHVGMIRNRAGLQMAIAQLATIARESDMALAGLMIAVAALRREESRGAHGRGDYPETSAKWACRQVLTFADLNPYLDMQRRAA